MSFEADIRQFALRTQRKIDRCVKDSIIELGKQIVENSIVGDANYWQRPAPPGYVGGKFRGNWQHAVDTMPAQIFETTANASVARITSTVPAQAAGKVHWLVNNVPYAIAIENGTASYRSPPQACVGTVMARSVEIVEHQARIIASERN